MIRSFSLLSHVYPKEISLNLIGHLGTNAVIIIKNNKSGNLSKFSKKGTITKEIAK